LGENCIFSAFLASVTIDAFCRAPILGRNIRHDGPKAAPARAIESLPTFGGVIDEAEDHVTRWRKSRHQPMMIRSTVASPAHWATKASRLSALVVPSQLPENGPKLLLNILASNSREKKNLQPGGACATGFRQMRIQESRSTDRELDAVEELGLSKRQIRARRLCIEEKPFKLPIGLDNSGCCAQHQCGGSDLGSFVPPPGSLLVVGDYGRYSAAEERLPDADIDDPSPSLSCST